MCSDRYARWRHASTTIAIALSAALLAGQGGPRFYPDDPLATDNDAAVDAGSAQPRDLSEQPWAGQRWNHG